MAIDSSLQGHTHNRWGAHSDHKHGKDSFFSFQPEPSVSLFVMSFLFISQLPHSFSRSSFHLEGHTCEVSGESKAATSCQTKQLNRVEEQECTTHKYTKMIPALVCVPGTKRFQKKQGPKKKE